MKQRLKNTPEQLHVAEQAHPRRLTIGFVLDDSLDRPDGVQQYVLTVGEWMRAQGHNVHYLVSTTTRRDVANIHDLTANVSVNFNGNRMCTPLPAPRRQIVSLLDEQHFDVLHVQMPYSPLFAGRVISAAGNGTAVVGTFHILPRSRLVVSGNRLLARWSRPTLKRFDSVVSVSPAAQAFAKDVYRAPSAALPNPIRLPVFRDAKPFARLGGAPLHVLFLGRLVERKGCMLLLQAVDELRRDAGTPPFVVTICGKGPLYYELQQFVRGHGLQKIVRFTGFVAEADKPRYYASADITAFPSSGGESFGIVLAEAMASGRSAVVAGDNPGYRSVLGDCPADVLFDPHNPSALAALLRRLMADAALRRHVAAWQKRHAERYDIARIGAQTYQLYRDALRHRQNMR